MARPRPREGRSGAAPGQIAHAGLYVRGSRVRTRAGAAQSRQSQRLRPVQADHRHRRHDHGAGLGPGARRPCSRRWASRSGNSSSPARRRSSCARPSIPARASSGKSKNWKTTRRGCCASRSAPAPTSSGTSQGHLASGLGDRLRALQANPLGRSHRAAAVPCPAHQRALTPPGATHGGPVLLRTGTKMDRLRSGAGRLSRRLCLGHFARAQGPQAGRTPPGGRLPARPGRSARWMSSTRIRRARHSATTGVRRTAGRARLRRLRAAQSLPRRRRLPPVAAQGEPAQAIALLGHHRAAQPHAGWLATLPFVDAKRIGFYGLSYGGKTAMRVPALLDRLCPLDLLGRFQRLDPQERVGGLSRQLHVHRRVRDAGMEPGQHVQLRRDGGADRARGPSWSSAATTTAWGWTNGSPTNMPKCGGSTTNWASATGPPSSSSTAGTRSTASGTFDFLHQHLNWPKTGE